MMGRMFEQSPDRGPPNALKGWLSDIYFPSLLPAPLDASTRDKSIESLAQRLGGRATVDDPVLGRTSALPALLEHLTKAADWLAQRHAVYERVAFATGIDRDVTEGTLALTVRDASPSSDAKKIDLPVAVVAERRREREVELRVYFSMQPLTGKFATRARLVPPESDAVLPQVVADHWEALQKGDVMAALACFQGDGVVRDARGAQHGKADDLKEYYERCFAGGAFAGGLGLQRGGSADDGRTCAIEYTLTKVCGREVPPQAGLMVYERGDSGLVRAIRLYDDIEM
jgi:hypothetical protein